MLFIQWLVFGETKQLSLKNKYRIYLGVGFADTLDPNDRCHCSKWFIRYEPTTGCLNGTRWAIRESRESRTETAIVPFTRIVHVFTIQCGEKSARETQWGTSGFGRLGPSAQKMANQQEE